MEAESTESEQVDLTFFSRECDKNHILLDVIYTNLDFPLKRRDACAEHTQLRRHNAQIVTEKVFRVRYSYQWF